MPSRRKPGKSKKPNEQRLRNRLRNLKARLRASEQVLEAIHGDKVDALVVTTSRGEQIYTLKTAEQPYRILVENMQEGAVSASLDGTILYANTRFAEIVGVPLEKVIGSILPDFIVLAERQRMRGFLAACREGTARGEYSLQHADGQIVPVFLSGGSTPAEGVSTICLVVTDLSDHRRIEERLRQSERLAGIGTFATGLAHEVNNPLHAILCMAEYALTYGGGNANPEIKETFETIVAQARRGGHIVRSVLDFARQESGPRTPCDLNAVVRSAAKAAKQYTSSCVPRFRFSLAPKLPEILANSSELEQVIVNLVKNACDAAEAELTITFTTEARNDSIRLTVADNGPGIPADVLPRLFDPFFTTRREKGGTGLGLSIVHGIVSTHGGSIGVESAPAEGARFVITLPVQRAPKGRNGPPGLDCSRLEPSLE